MLFADVNESMRSVTTRPIMKSTGDGSKRAWGPYGLAEPVLAGFLRVVTNSKVFNQPSSLNSALRFTDELRTQPTCVLIAPGRRHWEIFAGLCRAANAKGNLIPDAWFAALAIESGSEWISTDRDYSRFPGLRWRHPLQ